MANKFRGEMEIQIGEVKYLLRPTFTGLLEIEDRAGCGILPLVGAIGNGRLTTRQIVAILYGGAVGGGAKIDFEAFGEQCVEHGILAAGTSAAIFLAKVIEARQKKVIPDEQVL